MIQTSVDYGADSLTTSTVAELRQVSVRLGRRAVLEDVSAQIHRGELIGVIGPNGAGKSTLLRVLLGLVRPSSGEVLFEGRPVRRGNPRIGYAPQVQRFDREQPISGRDLVGLGLDGHRWGIGLPSRARAAKIDRVLEAVSASGFADAPVGQLSGGEQQRLAMGQAVVSDPSLLLLDEPLASLDLHSQAEVVSLVDRVRRERNLAVLFVTHGVNPLLGVMDRVWYLARGRSRIGRVDEVIRSEVLSDLYGVPVDVIEAKGRIFVSGADEEGHS